MLRCKMAEEREDEVRARGHTGLIVRGKAESVNQPGR